MSDKTRKAIAVGLFIVAAVAMAWPFVGGSLPSVLPHSEVTAVTYVYEKDDGGVPSGVTTALDTLNEQGIRATAVDEDVISPVTGLIPKQYAESIPAARSAGLPGLVIVSREKVLKVIKSPTTEAEVLEAAK